LTAVVTQYEQENSVELKLLRQAVEVVNEYLQKFIQIEKYSFEIPSGTSCGTIDEVPSNVTGNWVDRDLVV
jgi:hypothetical protein